MVAQSQIMKSPATDGPRYIGSNGAASCVIVAARYGGVQNPDGKVNREAPGVGIGFLTHVAFGAQISPYNCCSGAKVLGDYRVQLEKDGVDLHPEGKGSKKTHVFDLYAAGGYGTMDYIYGNKRNVRKFAQKMQKDFGDVTIHERFYKQFVTSAVMDFKENKFYNLPYKQNCRTYDMNPLARAFHTVTDPIPVVASLQIIKPETQGYKKSKIQMRRNAGVSNEGRAREECDPLLENESGFGYRKGFLLGGRAQKSKAI